MKRQRSRNRKPSGNQQNNNPNRAYESNGPDTTKVRGNAQTIYEKYQQLARDANSSGDRILAENYLQHAEHYFRLIRQMQPQRPVSEFLQRDPFNTFDFDDELDADGEQPETEAEQPETEGGEDQRGDRGYDNRRDRNDRNRDRDRNDRNRDRDRNNDRPNFDRQDRQDRQSFDRPDRQNSDRQSPDRAYAEREPRDGGDDQREGGRRESRRERYERRRQQRLQEQEVVITGGNLASTEPLSAPAPVVNDVAGLEVVTPQATPIAPQPQPLAEMAEVPDAPPRRGRRPRAEPVTASEEGDASHLPAFLRAPLSTPAAPAEASDADEAVAEAPKRRTRRKKSEEVGADEA